MRAHARTHGGHGHIRGNIREHLRSRAHDSEPFCNMEDWMCGTISCKRVVLGTKGSRFFCIHTACGKGANGKGANGGGHGPGANSGVEGANGGGEGANGGGHGKDSTLCAHNLTCMVCDICSPHISRGIWAYKTEQLSYVTRAQSSLIEWGKKGDTAHLGKNHFSKI